MGDFHVQVGFNGYMQGNQAAVAIIMNLNAMDPSYPFNGAGMLPYPGNDVFVRTFPDQLADGIAAKAEARM